jgi:hypothetical protein
MPMNFDVTAVQALSPRRLSVRFQDGLQGEVEIQDSHLTGVFEALKDPEWFAQVSCKEGFVTWPGELDLAPDAMYEAIRAKGIWVLD